MVRQKAALSSWHHMVGILNSSWIYECLINFNEPANAANKLFRWSLMNAEHSILQRKNMRTKIFVE